MAHVQEQLDISFCAGIAACRTGEKKSIVIHRAESALLEAQKGGRNQIRCIIGNDEERSVVSF